MRYVEFIEPAPHVRSSGNFLESDDDDACTPPTVVQKNISARKNPDPVVERVSLEAWTRATIDTATSSFHDFPGINR